MYGKAAKTCGHPGPRNLLFGRGEVVFVSSGVSSVSCLWLIDCMSEGACQKVAASQPGSLPRRIATPGNPTGNPKGVDVFSPDICSTR